ncbi:MAG: glutamate carboxypeptidase [Gemmatimonadetes bacterium]|jgi:N-acetylated-alpha-linked acidic dipeptidase|nr:glutamate carboxypeptidase [Gemmatimonadota bacterium]
MRQLAAILLLAPAMLAAQQAAPLPGFTPASSAAQRTLEAQTIARPSADRARAHSRAMTQETHVAGTAAQERSRDYVIAQMKAMGLETEVRRYDVFLPHPTSVQLWRTSPRPRALRLAEPPVAGDPTSSRDQYLTVNGYSGQGDVRGEVVYVNYGLIEDYATLDSLGISVKGRIAVARYGRSFRGIKAREAERHGAVALLIYSDPQDDGYVRGDVYPNGPMRNRDGVQRGSVMNTNGDPATPQGPSIPGAPRIAEREMSIPRIPVVPISYANAGELLDELRGTEAPAGWQGGLPFRYHVGPGRVTARVRVTDDRATRGTKPIWNTFGIIRGSELPDEIVMVGGHRDAWSPGAADNVSGTVSVLESARAIADAVRAGHRPRRTIVFATWDAEEWGLIGSTEYAEDDSLRLTRGGVAYLNQDVAAQGVRFGGGGSPSLRATLRDVARQVPNPNGRGSVYAEWRRAESVPDSAEPSMGDPGGGSDFAGFYNHLGIPILEWGFGGAGGVYHSQYDSFNWMSRFGDSTFAYHATAARIGAGVLLRLANADILPYDYVEYARTMQRYLPAIDAALATRRWAGGTQSLRGAIAGMEREAAAFATARDALLGGGGPVVPARTAAANAALRDVERALTRPEGLRGRPWFRNLIYVADVDNGYSNMAFPSINEAIRAGNASLTTSEIADLARRFDAATAALARARTAMTR